MGFSFWSTPFPFVMCTRSIRRWPVEADEFNQDAAGAGAVEFAELDALPGAEDELPALDQHGDAVADERSLDVAVAVAFPVLVVGLVLGDQGLELAEHV